MSSSDSTQQPSTPQRRNPYSDLPASRFWKAGVAQVDSRDIDLQWRPKFPITKQSRIATVGSCFAQHISRALVRQGFNWVDSEPAPPDLAESLHASHGHGVFSFRTGNIYTPALLKQWILWATGRQAPSTETFEENGRHFDPFRPAIPPDGYASRDELFAARQVTLDAIRKSLTDADILVFTLGLTEAWMGGNGETYPMCPGTIRGEFSPKLHRFHNFDYAEVMRDLGDAFDEIRTLNPGIKFLLTVSPVPLTATATEEHVLVATTYSKSVLRAAAGSLAKTRGDVDYFPSYELISAPAFKGQFYEVNLRSVTSAGVEFVMGQFLRALEPAATSDEPTAVSRDSGSSETSSGKPRTVDEICEDIVLETWSGGASGDTGGGPANLVLVGDSQMGMIGKALEEHRLPYAGGAIMQSEEWASLEFLPDEEKFLCPVDEASRVRWDETMARSFDRMAGARKRDVCVLTNIGMHSMHFWEGFDLFYKVVYGKHPETILAMDVRFFISQSRQPHINLVRSFVRAGYTVVWVTDPPFLGSPEFWGFAEEILANYMKAIGCRVFSARKWIDGIGGAPPEFMSDWRDEKGKQDLLHGSEQYYRQLVKAIAAGFPSLPCFASLAAKAGEQAI